jgi:type IV pilus assembly protein PilW
MNTPKRHQTGFSIISLMIASAIGIFIIGGAAKVYLDSKNTFNARSAIAATTENYRFALQDMRRTLVMAGRGISPSDDGIDAYTDGNGDNGIRTFPAVGTSGIVSGDTASGSPWSPNPEDSSIVAVRYASGPAPCGLADNVLGTGNATITVRFLVNTEGNLICQVFQAGVELVAQPIVSGVAQMRVLYGLDSEPEIPDGVAERYLTAKEIGDSEWPAVVSIRIGLVVHSGDDVELPNNFRPSEPETLDLLGATYTAPDTNHVYKSASTTISLRNLHHVDRQNS